MIRYERVPRSRPRHEVPKWVLVLLRPGFRYDWTRDAWILRAIGSRHGPLLCERWYHERGRIRRAAYAGRRRLSEVPLGISTPMQVLVVILLAAGAGAAMGAMVSGSATPHWKSTLAGVGDGRDALTPPPILARVAPTKPAFVQARPTHPSHAKTQHRPAPSQASPPVAQTASATGPASTPAPTPSTSSVTSGVTGSTGGGGTGSVNAAPAPTVQSAPVAPQPQPTNPQPAPTSSSGGASSGSGSTGTATGGTGTVSGGG
jgi:hypothetical protein